jgi:SMODS-associated and fused to various effectors sensor domain
MSDSSPSGKKKKLTIAACPEGIKTAEKTLVRLGFGSKSNFAKSSLCSRTTITKFFNSKPIQVDSFKTICDKLGLKWQEIAGLTEESIKSDQKEKRVNPSPIVKEAVEPVKELVRQVTVVDEASSVPVENSFGKTDIQHRGGTFFVIRHHSFELLTTRISNDCLPPNFRHYKIKHIEFDQSSFFTNGIYDPISAVQHNNQLINEFLTVFQTNQEAAIGYYGIVHIPLQFCAGYAVSTWPIVVLFELDRNRNCWYQLGNNDSPNLDLSVSNISSPANAVAVAIRIAISFEISKNDVDDVVPQPYEDIQIKIGKPRIDAITHYSQVNEICNAFRQVLDDLHARFDKSLIVHVFYAGPVSLGFSLGRRISRTIHHQVIAYNYTAHTSPRYAWGVKINNVGSPESRVVLTKLLTNDNQL